MARRVLLHVSPAAAVLCVLAAACVGDNLSLPDLTQPAQLTAVSGAGQAGSAGSLLAQPLVVRVLDAQNRPVRDVGVTFVPGSGAEGSAVDPDTTRTDGDGRAAVRWVLGPSPGSQTLIAQVVGNGAIAAQFTAIAMPGGAVALRIEVQPANTGRSGVAFSRQPQLQLVNASGNSVQQAGLAVSAAISSAPPGATLSGSTGASTDAAGLAVFANLGVSGPSGSYTLTFTGPNGSGVTSDPIQVSAGEAVRLAMVTQPPTSVKSGEIIAPGPVVRLEDASGNGVTSAGVPVTVVLAGGGVLGGTLPVMTDAQGLASFGDLTVTGEAGARTLLFASNGLQSVVGSPILLVTVPGAGRSALDAPASVSAGEAAVVTVAVRDVNGSPVANVSVRLQATGSDNVIAPASALTSSTGTVAFTFRSTRAQTKSLTAQVGNVTVGPRDLVVTAGQPDARHTQANVPDGKSLMPTVITVEARDQWDNPLATGGAAITATLSGSNAMASVAVTDNGTGTYTLTYTPVIAGTDTVAIALGGAPIEDSPFTSKVRR